MYSIIEQNKSFANMSILLNDTKSVTSSSAKFDCAKECPCGVPVIPVPDQWLEVMVTGGFKVWHIIFIIIAFVVTIVVVYCCFHRCRIPRTKQEIEADLMRTNLASKFRDYLQEFPNEPTTFIEALKKVQDLEEKSSEQDDLTARKRKGWLGLKGKDRQEKTEPAGAKDGGAPAADAKVAGEAASLVPNGADHLVPNSETVAANPLEIDKKQADNTTNEVPTKQPSEPSQPPVGEQPGPRSKKSEFTLPKLMPTNDKTKQTETKRQKSREELEKPAKPTSAINKEKKQKDAKKLIKTKGENAVDFSVVHVEGDQLKQEEERGLVMGKVEPTTSAGKQALKKETRKRRDKPNLSRTKAAHLGPRANSMENQNQLNLTPATSGHHHHNQPHHQPQHPKTSASLHPKPETTQLEATTTSKDQTSGKTPRSRSKTKVTTAKHSTVIQIEPTPGGEQPDQKR